MLRAVPSRFSNLTNIARFKSTVGKLTCPFDKRKTIEDIPGPKLLPYFGSLLDFVFYKKGLRKARLYLPQDRVKQFGRIFYEKGFSPRKSVYTVNPEDVERIARSEKLPLIPKRVGYNPLFQHFGQKYNRKLGMFIVNGSEWYKYRSAVGKRMLQPSHIAKYAPEMNKIASGFVTRLAEIKNPNNEVVNLDFEVFKWSFESFFYTIFEKRFGAISENIDPQVQDFIQSARLFAASFYPTSYFPMTLYDYYHTKSYTNFVTAYEKMHVIAEDMITQELNKHPRNQKASNKSNLLQYLSEKLNREDIVSCVIDLFAGGVDTSSNTILWILYELGRNPDKQGILYNEISTILGNNTSVSYKQLQNMPYLKAVVKETLRLHPVVPELRRIVQENTNLSGYEVPSGTTVIMPAYPISHDPDTFQNPEQFQPERFLKANKLSKSQKFASLPFGFGRRMCVGRRVAELELHTLLCHMMLRFCVECPHDETVDSFAALTVIPDRPVRVRFIERN